MVCALAAALSGCTALVPQGPVLPETPVPAEWSAAAIWPSDLSTSAVTTSLAQWWQHFNDPLLSTLVTQALQANTSIRSAQAALQQSRALRDVQAAGMLPGVSASASAQRSKSGDLEASNSFRVGLDASWEPDVFGGKRSALNASEADAQATEATLADVQVSMAAEVALAYIQLRGQQAQLLIARNNLASQNETLQITDWRAQAGLITALEVEQARTASEQTGAQIPTLEASIAKTRHSLAVLTGQPPAALEMLLAASRPVTAGGGRPGAEYSGTNPAPTPGCACGRTPHQCGPGTRVSGGCRALSWLFNQRLGGAERPDTGRARQRRFSGQRPAGQRLRSPV